MKILVLTNLFPPHYLGGYELICYRVVRALKSRSHEIEVLTSDHRVQSACDAASEPGVQRSLKIHGFYGHPWLGIHSLRKLEAYNNGVLAQTIRRFRPELVYVWNMGGLSKSMLLTLQGLGIPTVFYLSDHWIARGLRGDVWMQWWNRKNPPLPNRVLRMLWTVSGVRKRWQSMAPTNPENHCKFSRIYFCSRAIKELTVAAGYPVAHAAVIYCPVNVEQFHGSPDRRQPGFRNLLYVGRLAADKGVMTTLRALAALKGKLDVHLNVYGSGDVTYEKELKEFAAQNQLPVRFASADADAMPAIYREHDALLFPSEWDEPFALTPIEAMASGLPVIGTCTGGSAELFRNEENALTYKAGDAGELAAQIQRFAENPDLRARCAANGFCEVRKRFAEPFIVDQIEAYLKETLAVWQPPGLPDYNA